MSLVEKYGYDDIAAALRANAAVCPTTEQADLTGNIENIDDFAACKITNQEDWVDSWSAFEAHLDEWAREIADKRIHGTTGEVPVERFHRAEAGALAPDRRNSALYGGARSGARGANRRNVRTAGVRFSKTR